MDDFNPYAAPEAADLAKILVSEAEEGRGVWRDGKSLVMSKFAILPTRCVKCNAPATQRLKIVLAWPSQAHLLWWVVVPFIGLFVYLTLVLTLRRTAVVEVPVCEIHRAKQARHSLISWIVGLAGIVLVSGVTLTRLTNAGSKDFFGEELSVALLLGVGSSMIFFGVFYGVLRAQLLIARKITKTHVWLNQVGPLYLADLPPLPSDDVIETCNEKPRDFEF